MSLVKSYVNDSLLFTENTVTRNAANLSKINKKFVLGSLFSIVDVLVNYFNAKVILHGVLITRMYYHKLQHIYKGS